MLRGRLLTESLRIGADLCVPSLRVVRVGRHDVSDSISTGQPEIWTFLDFEAPDEVADELGEALAESLAEDSGWYADFEIAQDHVIVFPGRVFRYTKGDHAGRAAAVEYGKTGGVPEHQLDWGE